MGRRGGIDRALCALLLAALALGARAQLPTEDGWPRSVRLGDTTLTAHPPQLDSWDGYHLRARLAVRARRTGAARADYGVVTLAAETLTDRGRRLVTVLRAQLVKADFPTLEPARARAVGQALAHHLASGARPIALDRLEAALAAGAPLALDPRLTLRNTPPRIVFAQAPALLLTIDGAPAWRALAGTPFDRVVNTRALLLRDGRGHYYLKLFDGWMTARAALGPWTVLNETGAALRTAFDRAQRELRIDPLRGRSTPQTPAPALAETAPRVIVATAPTELIVTDGEPRFEPIPGTGLTYAANTTGHLFRDDSDRRFYVLLAGRWFRATDRRGPWEFIAADRLPADFARIPDDSPKENIKAAVAGTAQARAAAVAAGIAQTARIDPTTPLAPPRFDGEPVFEPIDGTDLAFAANSATPVIRVDAQRYLALENGVWFDARQPRGPWRVAADVPAAIYSIRSDSPLYHVTFVRVYAVDDEAVTVGYTPGYLGTLVDPHSGVVVHGTGFDHRPWLGAAWFGRARSYGVGAAPTYTPWTGWTMAFGFGWSWGGAPAAAGWGWGAYPWWEPWGWGFAWGPAAYPWYPPAGLARSRAPAWDAGGWAAYSGNLYRNWGSRAQVARPGRGYETWSAQLPAARFGLSYNSRTGRASAGQELALAGPAPLLAQVAVAAIADDDTLFAGRDGRVYRRRHGAWQQFGDGNWQPLPPGPGVRPRPQDAMGPGHRRAAPPLYGERLRQLEREHAARQLGALRVHSLRAEPPKPQRPGGELRERDPGHVGAALRAP